MFPKKKKPIIVLFVCTGNSCRSVMAKGIMQAMVDALPRKEGEEPSIVVRSAGVIAVPGMGASRATIEVMREIDIDVSFHLSQRLTDEMVHRADYVFVMERFHVEEVVGLLKSSAGKVHLLGSFGLPAEDLTPACEEIPDPIGKSHDVYRQCRDLIKAGVERAFNIITEK